MCQLLKLFRGVWGWRSGNPVSLEPNRLLFPEALTTLTGQAVCQRAREGS